jgi:putative ABC transport system permease protein
MFVSLTSISNDLKKQIDQSVANSNIDVIVQEKGASTPVSSRVKEQSIQLLQELENVKSVSSIIIGSTRTSGLPYLFLFGIASEDPYLSVTHWLGTGLIEGSMFRPGKKELIIGHLAAERLKKKVGDTLVLGAKEEFIVSGIYWLGQGILDGGVVIDLEGSQGLLKRQGYVNLALIEGKNKQNSANLIRQIKEKFPDLSPTPGSSLRQQIRAISMIDGFVTAVSVTALLLSAVMILNTLMMAISERTREIGILMAIGWPRSMIMGLIVIEALVLGIMGGSLGFLLAFPALRLVALFPAMGPGWIPGIPSLEHFFWAVGLAGTVAGLSAVYPAIFATRLQPAAALRYE